jgi:hypothetical protein
VKVKHGIGSHAGGCYIRARIFYIKKIFEMTDTSTIGPGPRALYREAGDVACRVQDISPDLQSVLRQLLEQSPDLPETQDRLLWAGPVRTFFQYFLLTSGLNWTELSTHLGLTKSALENIQANPSRKIKAHSLVSFFESLDGSLLPAVQQAADPGFQTQIMDMVSTLGFDPVPLAAASGFFLWQAENTERLNQFLYSSSLKREDAIPARFLEKNPVFHLEKLPLRMVGLTIFRLCHSLVQAKEAHVPQHISQDRHRLLLQVFPIFQDTKAVPSKIEWHGTTEQIFARFCIEANLGWNDLSRWFGLPQDNLKSMRSRQNSFIPSENIFKFFASFPSDLEPELSRALDPACTRRVDDRLKLLGFNLAAQDIIGQRVVWTSDNSDRLRTFLHVRGLLQKEILPAGFTKNNPIFVPRRLPCHIIGMTLLNLVRKTLKTDDRSAHSANLFQGMNAEQKNVLRFLVDAAEDINATPVNFPLTENLVGRITGIAAGFHIPDPLILSALGYQGTQIRHIGAQAASIEVDRLLALAKATPKLAAQAAFGIQGLQPVMQGLVRQILPNGSLQGQQIAGVIPWGIDGKNRFHQALQDADIAPDDYAKFCPAIPLFPEGIFENPPPSIGIGHLLTIVKAAGDVVRQVERHQLRDRFCLA